MVRKKYEVKQHDRSDCGAACISSVCAYYGLFVPIIEVRSASGTSQNGTNLQGLIDAAPKFGMSARAMKAKERNWESLSGLDRPVIVHFERRDGWLHYVVLYKWSPDTATIMDPESGRLSKMPKDEFMSQWSGHIAVFIPTPEFKQGDRRTGVWSRFRSLLSFNKGDILASLAGSAAYILIGLSTSLFLQQLIDRAIPSANVTMLVIFAVLMAVMIILAVGIGYLKNLFIIRASLKTDCQLVMAYLKSLFRLPVSFFSNRTSGELNSRINDAYRVRTFIAVRFTSICISLMTLAASFVLMFTFYWRLALLILLYIPLFALLYKISDSVSRKINRRIIEQSAAFDAENVEALSGIHTIRYFGWQDMFLHKLEYRYARLTRESYRGGKCLSAFASAGDAVTRMLTFTILTVGTYFTLDGGFSTGEMVSFFTIAGFFTTPVIDLIDSNSEITQAEIAAERLFEIMDLEPEGGSREIPLPVSEATDISVENLSFSFPARTPLLQDMSFLLRHGAITAITGSNGCGKSTFASLLMRGYRPDSGRIAIAGTDIHIISLSEWRRYVSIVPQMPELFKGAILDNIIPGDEVPDAKRIAKLCTDVGLDGTLARLPEGILSDVGEGGKLLSGGERQKVALVRALYREPKVLILDEATASIDTQSREDIFRLLRHLADGGMTIIMITHENPTAADYIVDLDRFSGVHHEENVAPRHEIAAIV